MNSFLLAVTELFHVEPPQLDLAYLELNEAPMVKKTGDIFDDVKFFRKTYRWKFRILIICESRPLMFLFAWILIITIISKYLKFFFSPIPVPSVYIFYICTLFCWDKIILLWSFHNWSSCSEGTELTWPDWLFNVHSLNWMEPENNRETRDTDTDSW